MFRKIGAAFLFAVFAFSHTSLAIGTPELQLSENLPIAQTYTSEAKDSWGTVYFFPQYHKAPASDSSDAVNDKAEKTQEESYKIMKELIKKTDLDLIMVEGELSGEVDRNKKEELSKDIRAIEILETHYQSLKQELSDHPVDQKMQLIIFKKIENFIAGQKRAVILSGAPFKLWTENEELTLLGSENAETLEESRIIVRNHLYLNDALQNLNPINMSVNFEDKNQQVMKKILLMKLLQNSKSMPREDAKLEDLKEKARTQNNQTAYASIDDFQNLLDDLDNIFDEENEKAQSPNNLPSRADNPYSKIKDKKELNELYEKNTKELNEVIIERRNKEASENMANAMKKYKEDEAIFQFGAGHEEGMVEQLNKQGLDVVVIFTDTVSEYKKGTTAR